MGYICSFCSVFKAGTMLQQQQQGFMQQPQMQQQQQQVRMGMPQTMQQSGQMMQQQQQMMQMRYLIFSIKISENVFEGRRGVWFLRWIISMAVTEELLGILV
jgi:hypothetical protein